MQLTMTKSAALQALDILSGVIERSATLPICAHVRLSADAATGVTCEATNLRETIALRGLGAEIALPGALVMPLPRIHAFLKAVPDGPVTLTQPGPVHVRIAAGRTHADFPLLPVADFPDVPRAEATPLTVSAGALRALIRETRYAIDREATQFTRSGALMEWARATLTLVATDGQRMAVSTRETIQGPVEPVSATVPRRAWEALERMLGDVDEASPVACGLDVNRVWFVAGGRELSAVLIDGAFPSWRRVLPAATEQWIDMPCDLVRAAIRRLGIVSLRDKRSAAFEVAGSEMRCTADTTEGAVHDVVPVDVQGPPLAVHLNPTFLLDYIESIESETLRLSWKDPLSAVLCEAVESPGPRGVIMPMRP